MKKVFLALAALLPLTAAADVLSVTWTPPTTREDGSALPAAEIAGYRLVWMVNGAPQADRLGLTGSAYTLNTGALSGLVCVKLHTVDTDGQESAASDQACKKSKPGRPTNLRIR